ncbi:MAG: ABC transporter ATP-binding protein [Spirochaetaceae bacterium]|nr:MAG: ABC transporter ATP-binding protein [Spirochaetaceae bacterium]
MFSKFRLVLGFMKGNRHVYLGAVVAVGFAAVFAYAAPLIIRFTIDAVIGGEPVEIFPAAERFIDGLGGRETVVDMIWVFSSLIVLLTLGNGLFSFLTGRWASVASETTARRIRDALYDHLQRLSYAYHVKAETGDIIQRCTSDVETMRRFIAVQFVEIGRAVFLTSVALPIMFSLHRTLAWVSIPIIPIIFLFSLIFYRWVQAAFKQSDEAEGRLSTVLQENLTGVRVVRAFARQQFEIDKFDEKNREYRDLTYRLIQLLARYWSISDLMSMLQIGAVLSAGTYLAVTGSATIGIVVVFLTMEGMLLWPIRQMGRILADMGKASVAVERIKEILEEPIEPNSEKMLRPKILGAVEFRNVGFEYGPDRPILRDISFSVSPGQTVAILGPTGSGKSTLVHLLPRLYDYTAGSILIDGVELKDIDKTWIRKNIGFVLQEPFLYGKTLKENIGIVVSGADEASVFEASRTAAIHDVITEFEKGYDTPVGERGVTLSGGQKQRVAIARALVTESPILVFDDSLSAVDTETDAAIRRALEARGRKATTFIISHRLTTLSSADLILVIDDGRIVQAGTHVELLAGDGMYARIWNLQSSLEDEIHEHLVETQ